MKESKRTYRWENCGDINFIKYGGCLVRETDYEECYEVMYLKTPIYDYNGDYDCPMIVVHCFVDLSDWLKEDDSNRIQFNEQCGFDEDYIPSSLLEKQLYCADLVEHWGAGVWEFDPTFPPITKLGCYSYGCSADQMVVSKTIAVKFMREYNVPYRYLRNK